MSNTLPVALILFSNDMDAFLPMVEQERKIIEEALEHFDDTNRLKVVARSSVSIEEVFRLFNRYKGRILMFHFAGHAEGHGLQFNQQFEDAEMGQAVGLADLFRREVENGILQLVFLNGCSTNPQLELMKEAGVPSVISTYHPIEDKKAVAFAQQFYQYLSNAQSEDPFNKLPKLQQAFEHAIAYLKTAYSIKEKEPVEEKAQQRSVMFNFDAATEADTETWTLHTTQPDWRLPGEVAGEMKPFNELLTLQLIHAIQPHSKVAQKFLEKAQTIDGWEEVSRITDKAKDIIAYSFVGVMGIQLRKLFAIGKEPHSDQKVHRYLTNGLLTAKRALKLLSFAMISQLWDEQQQKEQSFPDELKEQLKQLFDLEFDPDIMGYLRLLQALCQYFESQQLSFPLPELQELAPRLVEEDELFGACQKLQEISNLFDKGKHGLPDCYAAERSLSVLLKNLHFLAQYRMISIKNITYEEIRNSPPRYLHAFTALGMDSKSNINTERINYVDVPISTDAVLLYKGRYQNSINLFPFIIDYNALTFESGAKICFYNGQDLKDGSLTYCFLDDNTKINIGYKATAEGDVDLNQLMLDPEKRKDHKLDAVFQQFHEAQKVLLPQLAAEEDFFEEAADEFEF